MDRAYKPIIVVSFAVFFLLVSCSSSTKASSGSGTATTSSSGGGGNYKVGETAKSGNFSITVHGVVDPFTPSNQFTQPKTGNRVVQVDVEVANISSKGQTFSSLLSFKLKDSTNKTYSESLSGEPGPSSPNGTIQPSQGERGFAYFEIPTGSSGLVLTVKGSLTAAGAQFALS